MKPAKFVLYLSIFVTKFVTFVSNENVVSFRSVLLFWCLGTSLLNYLSAKRKLTPQEINLNSLDMLRSGINTVRKILYTHGKEIRAINNDAWLNFHPALQFMHTIPKPELLYISWRSHSAFVQQLKIGTSVYYKETDTHNYSHCTTSFPHHCIYSQVL